MSEILSLVTDSLKKGILGFQVESRLCSGLAKAILKRCERLHIHVLPASKLGPLFNTIYRPPRILYAKGELSFTEVKVAIVGSREATGHAKRSAETFAQQLASSGVTVISGLARGVDTAAHRGALCSGGRTIAILGHGLDRIYPFENTKLAERIVQGGGLLLSEYPPGVSPLKRHFPARNRLISALSVGVLVIQAAEKSGSLITARYALEQNREVFVLPAEHDNPHFQGSHRLIQEGAKLVSSINDITEELPSLLSRQH